MTEFRKSMRKLRLLMWKQMLLRKNRWIISLVELTLPILIVWILSKNAESVISAKGSINRNATIFPSSSSKIFFDHNLFKCVVYAPNEKPLVDLMEEYREVFTDNNPVFKIDSVENEMKLELYLRKEAASRTGESNCVGIFFNEFSAVTDDNGDGLFSYTLRSSVDMVTDEKWWPIGSSTLNPEAPITEDPYLHRGFVSVQLGLNEAFFKYKKKSPAYNEMYLQAFPHPAYVEESTYRSSVPLLVCIVVLTTSLILSVPLISVIIEEKTSGVKELIKIVGMEEWLIWLGWLLHALIFSLISYTIVTYLLQHEYFGPDSAPIRNVNPVILWLCIMLYCVANIAFCFMFTAIFHQTTIASSMYVLTLVLLMYGSSYLSEMRFSYLRKIACFLPSAAFYLAFERIKYTEVHDLYLSWHNLFSENSSTLSLGYTFVMMIFDTFLYVFLAYYIGAINPGKFGARKSPLFIFHVLPLPARFIPKPLKSVLKKNQAQELVNLDDPPIDRFIEKPPSNLTATIKIKDLHKNFGSVSAVRGVSLDVYKDEITALLGHNGAGKTTTLAILTGVMKPTEGSIVYKDKLDVLKQMDEFRQNLGMCAQEDRLFPYLTVLDHLLFFGQLKGASRKDALKEAKEYMQLMELEEKSNSLVASLSGGMRRKLCLSVALMGRAETLILDEPTSGLDVESRRKIWDLLLEMRGSRTIILTTHHMEEADVLGDRIAIMHQGTIVCHGTSLFLKKSYNTGYQVTITKHEHADENKLTNLMKNSRVRDVSLEGSNPKEVVYKLPLTETSKFPELFRDIEESKNQLGIVTIGVSCTTMEQVFLKVGGVSLYDPVISSRRNSTVTDGGTGNRLIDPKKSGLALFLQQLYALSKKKLLYSSRNWINLFFRVIFPSLMMICLLQVSNKSDHSAKPLLIDYSLYPDTKVMVQNTSSSWPIWKNFEEQLEPYGVEIIASEEKNIVEGLLKYGDQHLDSYKHGIILAMEWSGGDEKNITFLYNRNALHSLPLGLNVIANHLARYRDNMSSEFVMTSHPLGKSSNTCDDNGERASSERTPFMIIWFIILAFYTIDLNTYFITAINVERLDGFKHIQLMSNVSPITYWLSNFIFDYIFFFLIILARIAVCKMIDDEHEFLKIDFHFIVLILILALFIASSLPFTYVLSYLGSSKDGSYLLLFIVNILSSVFVTFVYYADKLLANGDIGYSFWALLYRVVHYIVLLFPPMNYSLTFMKFFNTWFERKSCEDCESVRNMTCPEIPYLVYSDVQSDGFLNEVLYLIFDIILFTVLLSLIQIGYFEKLFNKIVIRIYGSSVSHRQNTPEEGDDDVQRERAKVDRLITSSSDDFTEFRVLRNRNSSKSLKIKLIDAEPIENVPLFRGTPSESANVLIAHKLRKNFIKKFRPFTAVADINFRVKASECFGLLGVNGAGKSTTFRMLTGDLLPTKGNSSIMNYKLSSNRTEYLSQAGYCAQSNCFLEELTGREMLSLVASLRGIHSTQLKDTVDKWLSILGLEVIQNRRCGSYSGGNKRKLCTAMSLIGDPAVVFLDEPTSGVDPVARRRLYAVMQRSRESGQAVVLTSHSMEECENLCDRLTILVKGRMQCIGTAQHLKQTYAQGFSVLIKISDSATSEALSTFKQRIVKEFNKKCVLKDAHKTQLYYQITAVDMLWSTLFEKLEKLKSFNKNVVEDYSLSDTSLEEVFIAFAKT